MMDQVFSETLRLVAGRWADPDHPARSQGTLGALEADTRFTQEGIAFAVNHAMDLLASGRLAAWIGETPDPPASVGVLIAGRAPFEGVIEGASAALAGHRVVVATQGDSPVLLARFLEEVAKAGGGDRWSVVPFSSAVSEVDAIIAIGTTEEGSAWEQRAERLSSDRVFMPMRGYGVAVVDGRETRADLSGLAEDVWLHDGTALASTRLLWAPADLEPDEILDVFASFRETFPAHTSVQGTLSMPTAFLAAAKQPHASGPGFLVSKGDPEPQTGAHLRWTPYDDLSTAVDWLNAHAAEIGYVSARQSLGDAMAGVGLASTIAQVDPGDAHRPEPGQPPLTEEFRSFLHSMEPTG